MDDCRLKRSRHRRRDSPVSSWKTWMPFDGLWARQRRETGQSRMPETQQARWEFIFHARHQKWWDWLLAVPATNMHKLLSYATKADLWLEQQPSETLRCEKCGVRVRGERGLKIHLQQWCGQSAHDEQTASRLEAKTETQGVELVKKWPCSYCQKEFSQTALLMSAHHVATDLFMYQHKHQQHQSPQSVNAECRHQHGQMTPQSKPPQHNFKKTGSGMMLTIQSMVVTSR